MHTVFRAIIVALLLVFIIGCSAQNEPSNLITLDELPSIAAESLTRQACAWQSPTYNSSISMEGLSFESYSVGVDCIASTYWTDTTPTTVYHNYILICDSKYAWDSSNWGSHARCNIYKRQVGLGVSPGDISVADETDAYNGSSPIRDPDSCEIIYVLNGSTPTLLTFIWDSYGNEIYADEWAIDTGDGSISYVDNLDNFPAELDTLGANVMDASGGIAVIQRNSNYDDFHIAFGDNYGASNYVRVYDENLNSVEDFDLSDDIVKDLCYIQQSSTTWCLYSAVWEVDINGGQASDDYIACTRWGGSAYSTPEHADLGGSGDANFPGILGISVRRFDDNDSGSLCVLMWDVDDLRGYRLNQVNFGTSANDYYIFLNEFDSDGFEDESAYPNSVINKAESLAVGKYYFNPRPGYEFYGNFYFIPDRDPDLTEEDDGGNGDLDGKNVKIFSSYSD